MLHINRYRMLEVRKAMSRERIFRDRTNPLEIYDDLELIKDLDVMKPQFLRQHIYCPIFSVFLLCLFLRNSRHLLCLQFPAIPYFCPKKLSTRKTLLQNNFSLLVLFQQYNLFTICPIWLSFTHFLFSTVTNCNIQSHPTLNVYPHKVIKACIIYLLKNLREITKDE